MVFDSLYKQASEQILEMTKSGDLNSPYSQKPTVLAIVDGSDIRKEYSKSMENLQTVLDLKKQKINGYRSVGAILTTEDISLDKGNKPKTWLLSQTVFSKKEKGYKSDKEYSLNAISKINKEIIKKPKNTDLEVIYLLDRLYDDQEFLYQLDKELKAKFVTRVSHPNRRVYQESPVFSNLPNLSQKQKQELETRIIETKLSKSQFDLACFTKKLPKLKIKNKTYFNVTIYYKASKILVPVFQKLSDQEELVPVVHLQVNLTHRPTTSKKKKQKGLAKIQNIYKQPIHLYSNLEIDKVLTMSQAEKEKLCQRIHKLYLKRWRIETIFKFLKDTLGMETFRLQHLDQIKKLIALTFLAGSYFYATNKEKLKDPPLLEELAQIAKLGCGKGVIGPKFVSQGIQTILHYHQTKIWMEENNITEEMMEEIKKKFGIDKVLKSG